MAKINNTSDSSSSWEGRAGGSEYFCTLYRNQNAGSSKTGTWSNSGSRYTAIGHISKWHLSVPQGLSLTMFIVNLFIIAGTTNNPYNTQLITGQRKCGTFTQRSITQCL